MTTSLDLSKRTLALVADGGPDAFISAEVARRLIRAGARVGVAVTATMERWLPSLTLATVSAAQVARTVAEGEALAGEADGVVLMASGTELVSGLVAGRMIDAAGAAYLCADAPRVICLGGEVKRAPWVDALLEVLSEDAVILPRGEAPEGVVEAVSRAVGDLDLEGRRVLVTAGPTREHIDPVRFISNPSTGRMGMALADAARRRGAEVTLLLGPTPLSPPAKVRTHRFETAEELWGLASAETAGVDVVLATAAVGDYAPVSPFKEKIKKREGGLELALRRTPDVLARLGARFAGDQRGPILVGFAAETEDVVENARRKLESKKLDLVVANDVSGTETGFASTMNEVVLVEKSDVVQPLSRARKDSVAHAVLDKVVALLAGRAHRGRGPSNAEIDVGPGEEAGEKADGA